MSRYPIFNRENLKLKPLGERKHDLSISDIKDFTAEFDADQRFVEFSRCVVAATKKNAAVILMLGGHVIRSGTQKYIIDLMEKGYISCLAMNGSGMIHDFEFALIGATTESVAKYIQAGQFGLWKETGRINDIINQGYLKKLGMGESVGREIFEGDFAYKDISLMAAGYRLKIPVTVHVGIGYDIIHEHPNCDGAATGGTSYQDFLYFTKVVESLEGGAIMNFGSSVMAPEVFLKALSMARNTAHLKKKAIKHFAALVCDLYELPGNFSKEPDKSCQSYYFRPWKTMLVRTVADGGKSYYIRGRHEDTIPALWKTINENSKN